MESIKYIAPSLARFWKHSLEQKKKAVKEVNGWNIEIVKSKKRQKTNRYRHVLSTIIQIMFLIFLSCPPEVEKLA